MGCDRPGQPRQFRELTCVYGFHTAFFSIIKKIFPYSFSFAKYDRVSMFFRFIRQRRYMYSSEYNLFPGCPESSRHFIHPG